METIVFNKRKYFKRLSVLIPASSIVIAVLYFIIADAPYSTTLGFSLVHSLLMTSGIWMGCSFIIAYLWNRIPWEHQPAKRLLIEIPAIILYTIAFGGVVLWFELKMGFIDASTLNLGNDILITLLITLLITSINESVFFYQQWKVNFSRSVRLEKDSIEANFQALKNQINPHFLFNSLNGLTTMVGDNKKAVEYIENLSDFLRYMLKNRDNDLVPLSDEMAILKKYISLIQSRFGSSLKVEINVDASYNRYSIPPLVLQMLVENCIKHNIITSDKPLHISIFTEQSAVVVMNNLQLKPSADSTGHGLKNIVDRYRYFTTKAVKIDKLEETFRVSVPLLIVNT